MRARWQAGRRWSQWLRPRWHSLCGHHQRCTPLHPISGRRCPCPICICAGDIVPILKTLNWSAIDGYHNLQRRGHDIDIRTYQSPPQYDLWAKAFEPFLGVAPPVIKSACCAQFYVTRDVVRRLPRAAYEVFYEYAMDPATNAVDVGRCVAAVAAGAPRPLARPQRAHGSHGRHCISRPCLQHGGAHVERDVQRL